MAEVNEVPVAHAPVDGRVLAHRRDDDAIGQFLATDPERREQRAHAPPRAVRASTRTFATLRAIDFLVRGEELLRNGLCVAPLERTTFRGERRSGTRAATAQGRSLAV